MTLPIQLGAAAAAATQQPEPLQLLLPTPHRDQAAAAAKAAAVFRQHGVSIFQFNELVGLVKTEKPVTKFANVSPLGGGLTARPETEYWIDLVFKGGVSSLYFPNRDVRDQIFTQLENAYTEIT
jgi:hypothetical protein